MKNENKHMFLQEYFLKYQMLFFYLQHHFLSFRFDNHNQLQLKMLILNIWLETDMVRYNFYNNNHIIAIKVYINNISI